MLSVLFLTMFILFLEMLILFFAMFVFFFMSFIIVPVVPISRTDNSYSSIRRIAIRFVAIRVNIRADRNIRRTNRTIGAESYASKIRATISRIATFVSDPERSCIMVDVIMSAPIIADGMKITPIMTSAIRMIMVRRSEIEVSTVRVVHIHPETPTTSAG